MIKNSIQDIFGNIDIYLFDQLLKGRFNNCKRILDAGCGNGRNLLYFMQNNFEVFAVDKQPEAINEIRHLARHMAPHLPMENFLTSKVETLPFKNHYFDLILSSAVLHFATNQTHFEAMLYSMWRVLKPGGYLFIRLASTIGIEPFVIKLSDGRYCLPDGSERFLVNESMLLYYTDQLKATLFEYIKTTNVQNLRCMTTWCLQKGND
jgi:tellurite methyltransferase